MGVPLMGRALLASHALLKKLKMNRITYISRNG